LQKDHTTLEGEREFDLSIKLPQDISVDFFERFGNFLRADLNEVKAYFSELLSFKRATFKLVMHAPMRVISEIEKHLILKSCLMNIPMKSLVQPPFMFRGEKNSFIWRDLLRIFNYLVMTMTVATRGPY
jgi:hypothetical protein